MLFQKTNKSFSKLTLHFLYFVNVRKENYVRMYESWLQISYITQMYFASYSHYHWKLYQRPFSSFWKLYPQHIHVLIKLFRLFCHIFFGKMFKMYQRPQRAIVKSVRLMIPCSNDYDIYWKLDMSDKHTLVFTFLSQCCFKVSACRCKLYVYVLIIYWL